MIVISSHRMEKYYPISAYIKCIEKLKIPYPTSGLKSFLSGYTEKFTRHTDTDNILFNGRDAVIIKKVAGGAEMSSEDIDEMLMGLIVGYDDRSEIVSKYKFASIQLSKRRDPVVSVSKPKITSHSLKSPSSPKSPQFHIKSSMTEEDKASLLDAVEDANNNIRELENTHNIPEMTESDAMDIIVASDLPISTFLGESEFREFLADVWLDYHGYIVLMEFATWPSLFPEKVSEGDVLASNVDPNKLLKALSSRLMRIRTLKNVKQTTFLQSPSPKIQKKKEDLISAIKKAGLSAFLANNKEPEIENNVRGMFHSLLATHNTSLDTALNMFLGKYQYIRGVEKTGDHIYPAGRGAQFRWGIDSQYGDVIFIMKPQFWKNYSKGVKETSGYNPTISNEVVFNDFWAGSQTNEAGAKKAMEKEAKNFGFREPKVVDADYCKSEEDRKNLTWCNIQIHIGENVSFDDIDVVLVPKYLYASRLKGITFDKQDVSDIIFRAQFQKTIEVDGVSISNPFFGKLIEYGPISDTIPHYSVILKQLKMRRHPIYDVILKNGRGHPISESIGDAHEKYAVENALHRARWGGNSSMIGLSQYAYIEAETEYMFRLLEHNFA